MKSVLLVLLFVIKIESQKSSVNLPNLGFECCYGSPQVCTYSYGLYPLGEENQYYITLVGNYTAGTSMTFEFDSKTNVAMPETLLDFAELLVTPRENVFLINCLKQTEVIVLIIKGVVNGIVPYFNSIKINGVEQCASPVVGYLDDIVKDLRLARRAMLSLAGHECGRRKIDINELIINGEPTEPGEWPWHAAIYIRKNAKNSYACGGTLISKIFVLTGKFCSRQGSILIIKRETVTVAAAQCVTLNNNPLVPDILSVVLGKYHMLEADITSEEREVYSVIIHNEYGSPKPLDNDIALLKLKSEAVYNNYVQPACLWSSNAFISSSDEDFGTVVGWGYNKLTNTVLSSELKKASMPMISELKCLRRNFAFYGTLLKNERKFCAGWGNGTSPCNGDSGGGFMVFEPNKYSNTPSNKGSWYIRGIVSTVKPKPRPGIRVCDPDEYVVFTDVSKYVDWIQVNSHINNLNKI